MRKFLLTVLLVCNMLFFTSNVEAAPQVYDSEQAAIEDKTKEVQENNYRPGTYPVSISYNKDGKIVTQTIYVTIQGANTVVKGATAIDAHSSVISVNKVSQMTDEKWIALTEARAWNTETAAELPVTRVDASAVQAFIGEYPIIFFTVNGVSTTVTITVNDNSSNNISVYEFFSGNGDGNDGGLSWYENFGFTILKVAIVSMLALPIIILLIQYFLSLRVYRNLKNMLIERYRK